MYKFNFILQFTGDRSAASQRKADAGVVVGVHRDLEAARGVGDSGIEAAARGSQASALASSTGPALPHPVARRLATHLRPLLF